MSKEHLKKYGQYFTHPKIANFMMKWIGTDFETILDPALGNNIFFKQIEGDTLNKHLVGFEIDSKIIDHFGYPVNTSLFKKDFLTSTWEKKYDAIVCNPPYNKFQSIKNRDKIIDDILKHTGIELPLNTNLYILFLIKSIFLLNSNGKMAFIIPSEFLNSEYGNTIKKILLEKKLLNTIISFKDDNIFYNATTTSCILLLDSSPKEYVSFYKINNMDDLSSLNNNSLLKVSYNNLDYKKKWRVFLNQENSNSYKNLKKCSSFLKASRGIATGSNEFFCFSLNKKEQWEIPDEVLLKCICRSADVKKSFFSNDDFYNLEKKGKNVYLLDANYEDENKLKKYLSYGITKQIHTKYLPAHRTPWFSMEQKKIAPIWIASANRKGIKVVRNLAEINNLTTFHSVYINKNYSKFTDLIFCYLLTPIAQEILYKNRKELGNGLIKFQPSDLNSAEMIDIEIISELDYFEIIKIYNLLKNSPEDNFSIYINELNNIFSKYLT